MAIRAYPFHPIPKTLNTPEDSLASVVRRIVTGHDANCKAIVKTDERLPRSAGWDDRTKSPCLRILVRPI